MPDEAKMLAEHLESLISKEHILITRLGCATSTYVGPGTLVMALIEEKKNDTRWKVNYEGSTFLGDKLPPKIELLIYTMQKMICYSPLGASLPWIGKYVKPDK